MAPKDFFLKGDVELSSQLIVGIIIALTTIFLLYIVFPRSSCDAEAKLTALEMKKAIECAAGAGEQGCSSTATIKLCQEDAWSLVGFGWVQNYFGLMVPEYLVYYQKFPTKPVEQTFQGANIPGSWSESYPFERATIGQRFWDFRPTLTQFKQFYRTKYLQEGCSSGTALCVNIRGREEVLEMNIEDITDIKLSRPPTGVSELNPKFHLVAPCFARVKFEKFGTEIIGRVDKMHGAGASNYCYTDEGTINNLQATYAAERACQIGMIALDVLSLGTKKGAEIVARTAAKAAYKQVSFRVLKETYKNSIISAAKLTGKKVDNKLIRAAEKEATNVALRAEIQLSDEGANKIARKAADAALKGGKFQTKDKVEKQSAVYATTEAEALANVEARQIAIEEATQAAIKAGATPEEAAIIAREAFEATGFIKLGIHDLSWITRESLGSSGGKKFWGDIAWRVALRRGAASQGISENDLKSAFGLIPCVDLDDVCRGGASCVESLMWPGIPFSEMTSEKMKKGKFTSTASEIFTQCCSNMNYGPEKNPDKVYCEEPASLAELVREELGTAGDQKLNLTAVAEYINIKKGGVEKSCEIFKSETFKTCEISDEVVQSGYGTSCSDYQSHTYTFAANTKARVLSIFARTFEDGCRETLKTEISEGGPEFSEADSRELNPYPEGNYFTLKFNSEKKIAKVKLSATHCRLDYSSVSLDANSETAVEAEANVPYSLPAGKYKIFVAPEGFNSAVSDFCAGINFCISITKFHPDGSMEKFEKETGKDAFKIIGGDKVGILPEKDSSVAFSVSKTEGG